MQKGPVEQESHSATVLENEAGTRLDAFLAARFPDFSRNRIKELILEGAVTVEGTVIEVPRYRVKAAESIALTAPPPVEAEPEAENIPLMILYEDEHLIVIDKPAGMVVHPAPSNETGTLVNALIHHCGASLKGIGGVKRPGIVHRLDKDTSGVMVAAKTEAAHNGLAAQFADHGRSGPLERAYTAFVWGIPNPRKATIETRMGRDPNNRLKQAVVGEHGRIAITHYEVEARFGAEKWQVAQLECRLETGRTHQIRVHLANAGHPLLGDALYGSGFATKSNTLPDQARTALKTLNRQALHASVLGFSHPVSGETLRFVSPIPPDLDALATGLAAHAL